MKAKKNRPIAPDDLYRFQQPMGCQLSPDGQWLVTTVGKINPKTNESFTNIWLQPAHGGKLVQVTYGEHNDKQPCFSPDGKQLAFISDRSGSTQVHLINLEGGESWQLTRIQGRIFEFIWSPDGKDMCVCIVPDGDKSATSGSTGTKKSTQPLVHRFTGLSCDPKHPYSELHIVNTRTGNNRALVQDKCVNCFATFAPDGNWVVFCSNKYADKESEWRLDLWKVRVNGKGKPRKVTTHESMAYYPSVSPDGKWIAFTGCRNPQKVSWSNWYEENVGLFVVSAEGGQPRNLSESLDRTVVNMVVSDVGLKHPDYPLWDPDSNHVYSVVTTEGNVEIHRFSIKAGAPTIVFNEPGVALCFDIDFNRELLYCLFSNQHTPGDLFSCRLPSGELKQLTRFNSNWLSRCNLGTVEEIRCKGADQNMLQGWIIKPPQFSSRKKYPAILYIHDGPYYAFARSFFHEFQYLAGLGYVVFYCNPRGSQGYGKDHLGAIADDWGNHDYRDLMKFTDNVLKKNKFIDRKRVGVTGESYGGFMATWIIGHTKRFKAAVTQGCLSNFLSLFGDNPYGFLDAQIFCRDGKTPWEDTAHFLAMSPMTFLPKATTPTLVMHCEKDRFSPDTQGQQVYTQLKLQGVETEFVRFPEEGHELSSSGRTDRRIERLKCISGWFDRYLK